VIRRRNQLLFFVLLALSALRCGTDEPISAQATGGSAGFDAGDGAPKLESVALERLFPTSAQPSVEFPDCTFSSALVRQGAAGKEILLAVADRIVALHPLTGALLYELVLPGPSGEHPFAISTPVLVGNRLIVAYHTTSATTQSRKPGRDVMDPRLSQIVAVLDLEQKRVDPEFPFVVLAAEKPAFEAGQSVKFRADKALQRGTLVHHAWSGELGRVIVTFGNARDLQPWHGWAFELSLDAWKSAGAAAAVSGVLLVTPEHDCGPENASGSRARICGGGLWAPSGPLMIPESAGYQLILPPGNGQLDLARGDYANTLMRVGPTLAFDPECDDAACSPFDPDQPPLACIESCKNLFVPRIPAGDPPFLPESGVCEGTTMLECWEKLDYVGGSTPVRIEVLPNDAVLAYPTKDGHVYLVDAEHLGTLHHRKKLVDVCGSSQDACQADWAGMIVTEPAVGKVGERTLLVVPTFMPDKTHPAGVFALAVDVSSGQPRLETVWTFPEPGRPEARQRFRLHPSRASIATLSGSADPIVVLVEPGTSAGKQGRLIALRLADGLLLADTELSGRGMRFGQPLIVDDVVYTPSCASDFGTSKLEAHWIRVTP
jgi:hypothetical protein